MLAVVLILFLIYSISTTIMLVGSEYGIIESYKKSIKVRGVGKTILFQFLFPILLLQMLFEFISNKLENIINLFLG